MMNNIVGVHINISRDHASYHRIITRELFSQGRGGCDCGWRLLIVMNFVVHIHVLASSSHSTCNLYLVYSVQSSTILFLVSAFSFSNGLLSIDVLIHFRSALSKRPYMPDLYLLAIEHCISCSKINEPPSCGIHPGSGSRKLYSDDPNHWMHLRWAKQWIWVSNVPQMGEKVLLLRWKIRNSQRLTVTSFAGTRWCPKLDGLLFMIATTWW